MSRPTARSTAPHSALLERFLSLLTEQARLLSEIVRVVSNLRDLIVRNEIGSIEQRVTERQQLVQTLADREPERVQALQELAVRFDLKAGDITVRRLANVVGGELGRQLAAVADDLQRHGAEVARVNRQNAAMIVQSADLTREVIQVLTNSDPGGNSYNAGGGRQDAVGGSMIELDG